MVFCSLLVLSHCHCAHVRRDAASTTPPAPPLPPPGVCSWLCNKYCKKSACRKLCNYASRGCKGVCGAVGAPWFVCMWL